MATSVLLTGVSRRSGIAWTVVEHPHQACWEVTATGWPPRDEQQPWGADPGARPDQIGCWVILLILAACGGGRPEVPPHPPEPAVANTPLPPPPPPPQESGENATAA